jgi:hypothetical protein
MSGEGGLRSTLLSLVVFVGMGCGGAALLAKDAGPSGDGSRPACPGMTPTVGAPCDADGELCAYGDAADPLCRSIFVCRGSAFAALATDAACSAVTCAAGTKTGDACGAEGDACRAADGTACFCSSCVSPGGGCNGHDPWWHCQPPPASPCPQVAPNAGATCEAALSCFYGTSSGLDNVGVCARCDGANWDWFPPGTSPNPTCSPQSCVGSCVSNAACSANTTPSQGICPLGSTCCTKPQTCSSSATCPTIECCVAGECTDKCGGTCATASPAGHLQFCADDANTCSSGDGQGTVVTSCAGGACCTDAARAVCCQVNTGG